VTYFKNFETTAISREQLKLETSNLARILIKRGTNEKNAKFGQRGHVTCFWNFGSPPPHRNGWSCKPQIWHAHYHEVIMHRPTKFAKIEPSSAELWRHIRFSRWRPAAIWDLI